MTVELALFLHILMESDVETCAGWKSDWLLTLENGLMICVSAIRCKAWRPAAIRNIPIDCVGDAEAGSLGIGQRQAEFDRVCDARIFFWVSFDGKFFDQNRPFVH